MKVKIEPGALCGTVTAPPSKSLTHRKLICSALSGRPCRIENVMLSEDILATMDCLSALGAEISRSGNTVTVDGSGIFVQSRPVHMPCRASGSTLRFLLPVVLALGRPAVFDGEASLFCRPLGYYEDLCRNQGILWEKGADSDHVEPVIGISPLKPDPAEDLFHIVRKRPILLPHEAYEKTSDQAADQVVGERPAETEKFRQPDPEQVYPKGHDPQDPPDDEAAQKPENQ